VTVQILYLTWRIASTDGRSDSDITYAAYAGIALAVVANHQLWTAMIVAFLLRFIQMFVLIFFGVLCEYVILRIHSPQGIVEKIYIFSF